MLLSSHTVVAANLIESLAAQTSNACPSQAVVNPAQFDQVDDAASHDVGNHVSFSLETTSAVWETKEKKRWSFFDIRDKRRRGF